jgi:dihydrofolate synthase/folylpolyglutamate synthase
VSDVADGPARVEIEAGCARAGAPFIAVRERSRVEPRGGTHAGQSFDVVTANACYALALPVLGGFQRRNAATAVVVLENLPEYLRPTPHDVERGLASVAIAGRMEYFPAHPSIVFDIAHNADKAANLASALREEFPAQRFAFVVAIGESKDATAIVEPLAELPASFVFTTFEVAGRPSTRPQRLASIVAQRGVAARAIADSLEAFAIARRTAGADDIVVVTGSTFIVATLRAWWLANVVAAHRR